jgi:hypothetical protein
MLPNHRHQDSASADAGPFSDFHEWILSLPWTVERPYALATPGVRCFDVDCPPLGRRQIWLLSGLHTIDHSGLGLAVIVPVEVARELAGVGWGRTVVPMPGRRALVTVDDKCVARRIELETVVLAAYGEAMS